MQLPPTLSILKLTSKNKVNVYIWGRGAAKHRTNRRACYCCHFFICSVQWGGGGGGGGGERESIRASVRVYCGHVKCLCHGVGVSCVGVSV